MSFPSISKAPVSPVRPFTRTKTSLTGKETFFPHLTTAGRREQLSVEDTAPYGTPEGVGESSLTRISQRLYIRVENSPKMEPTSGSGPAGWLQLHLSRWDGGHHRHLEGTFPTAVPSFQVSDDVASVRDVGLHFCTAEASRDAVAFCLFLKMIQ